MNNQIQNAFESITASEDLKKQTFDFVAARLSKHCHGKLPSHARTLAFSCCMAAFVLCGLGGIHVYGAETSLISIDINPSIELGINRFGRVIRQTAYGKDGEAVLKELSLQNLSYEDAVEIFLTNPMIAAYYEDGTLVSVTIETTDDAPADLSSLETRVNQILSNCHADVTTSYCHTDRGMADTAHGHGLSVGKYCAIRELLEVDPSATIEEYRNSSMEEIEAHTHDCCHEKIINDFELENGDQEPFSSPEPSCEPGWQTHSRHHGHAGKHD